MTMLSATFLLILVLDPIGNVPFFLSTLEPVAPARRRRVMARELLVALAALLIFLFAGPRILALMGIEGSALGIAGGVILFLIALRMTFPSERKREEVVDEPFIVPLAIPFVAGPSALATVLLINSAEPDRWPEWLAATVIAWVVTGAVLFASEPLGRMLGRRGMIAVERLMGMILTAVAVQMLISGVRQLLATS